MPYLAAMSAHCPQALQRESVQSLAKASAAGRPVSRMRSSAAWARQAMRAEGAVTTFSGLAASAPMLCKFSLSDMGETRRVGSARSGRTRVNTSSDRVVDFEAPKNPGGSCDGSHNAFGMNTPLSCNQDGERVFCQSLARRISAVASERIASETAAFSSGVPEAGSVSRDSAASWRIKSAAKRSIRVGSSPLSQAAKSWVQSRRSVEQSFMAARYGAETVVFHALEGVERVRRNHGTVIAAQPSPRRGA